MKTWLPILDLMIAGHFIAEAIKSAARLSWRVFKRRMRIESPSETFAGRRK